MIINSNNYSVIEIIAMLERRELVVNNEYQRSSGLWPDGPSSYFIDTIIEKFPFPKIYMYETMDRAQRAVRKEIVDGQQRIKAITRFYNNEFALRGVSRYAGLFYRDLDGPVQDEFLSYPVSVDVIRNATRAEVLQIFRRMNAYTLPLNEPEKRHSSYQVNFKWFINRLSDHVNEFFVEFSVLTDRQILRMADADLLSDCVLAIQRGVVSTSPRDLTVLYKNYDDNFPQSDDYWRELTELFSFISAELSQLRGTFMMKPYALHSLVTALYRNRYGIRQISESWDVAPTGQFARDAAAATENLFTLAQAHEAREEDGPFATYVWGCAGATNRAPRRTARVASILRALGIEVPVQIDGDLA